MTVPSEIVQVSEVVLLSVKNYCHGDDADFFLHTYMLGGTKLSYFPVERISCLGKNGE